MIETFQADIGITVDLLTDGSNDEVEQELKAAGGKGFDVIFPSVTNGNNYEPDNLLQPLDEGELELGNLHNTGNQDLGSEIETRLAFNHQNAAVMRPGRLRRSDE